MRHLFVVAAAEEADRARRGRDASDRMAAPPRGARRRVILLLLDAARPDRLSCNGNPRATTPEIDRLAARGGVFERHYAQGTGTRLSVSLRSLVPTRA